MTSKAGLRDLSNFWSKISIGEPDECWPWMASRYPDGYGMVGIRNQGRSTTMRAHAFALTLATAEDANGRFTLHHCDNPPCCNPAHLYWGNQRQNIKDMDSRGRGKRVRLVGSKNPRAKLTEESVAELRRLYAEGGWSQQALADKFGVSQQVVSTAIRRVTWAAA